MNISKKDFMKFCPNCKELVKIELKNMKGYCDCGKVLFDFSQFNSKLNQRRA